MQGDAGNLASSAAHQPSSSQAQVDTIWKAAAYGDLDRVQVCGLVKLSLQALRRELDT